MPPQQSPAIWPTLESRWPAVVHGKHISFRELRQQMLDFLTANSLDVRPFSHFGFVVADIDASLASLAQLAKLDLNDLIKDWVPAYRVHVARAELDGTEFELIAPAGPSFFDDFLKAHGQRLHHLSFRVADIDNCLALLTTANVNLIDNQARSGSHGRVAFAKPAQFEPLYLELCQPSNK